MFLFGGCYGFWREKGMFVESCYWFCVSKGVCISGFERSWFFVGICIRLLLEYCVVGVVRFFFFR